MSCLAMILLGNGFDIALGAKTKYSDFAQSEQFQILLTDNKLAQYIWKKFEMQDKKWVDVELELARRLKVVLKELEEERNKTLLQRIWGKLRKTKL